VLLAGLIGGALWLLYPRQDLERRLATATADTDIALSVVYLENLLRSDPANMQLHLLLARQHLLLGELPEAREELQRVRGSSDPQIQRELAWLDWELDYAGYIALAADSEERARLRPVMKQKLQALRRYDWPADRLARLGQWGAQFHDPAFAQQSARELAARQADPEEAARLYEQAAREALGVSDYETCAQLYILARRTTTDPQHAKAYFLAALDALQSGNRLADAVALGEREIGVLIDDPQVLLRMTELARAAARPDVADRYVRKLLRMALLRPAEDAPAPLQVAARPFMQPAALRAQAPRPAPVFDDGAHWLLPPGSTASPALGPWRMVRAAEGKAAAQPHAPGLPFDDKVYSLAYEVFLENRKQDDAWAIARAAVRQRPQDIAWRERLARVSEWTERADVPWRTGSPSRSRRSAPMPGRRCCASPPDSSTTPRWPRPCCTSCAAARPTCAWCVNWWLPTNAWASPSTPSTTCRRTAKASRPRNCSPSWPSGPDNPNWRCSSGASSSPSPTP